MPGTAQIERFGAYCRMNSAQADYDGNYSRADKSKLLYWIESYLTQADRSAGITISGGDSARLGDHA